jgi:hypothetical protein
MPFLKTEDIELKYDERTTVATIGSDGAESVGSFTEPVVLAAPSLEGPSSTAAVALSEAALKSRLAWVWCGRDDGFLPTYPAFCSLWRNALTYNPLEVKWMDFDLEHHTTRAYALRALDLMEEQLRFWETNPSTLERPQYRAYLAFYKLLYTVYGEESTVGGEERSVTVTVKFN